MLTSIPRVLDAQAERYGARPLVSAPGGDRSYAELRDDVAARAGTLIAQGLEPGDRVALMSSNRIELLETMLACAWAGLIAVPVNTALRGAGLRHVLGDSAPALLVVEREHVAAAEAALDGHRAIPSWVIGATSWPEAGEAAAPWPARTGDIATILYTSGTTGPSKGVLGPHGQILYFARGVRDLLELSEDDVLFTSLPLFHINAWSAFFQALISGGHYVITPRFSASRFVRQAIEAGATVTYLIGAMVSILLRQPPSEFDRAHSIRIVNGAAPPGPAADDLRERFGLEIAECYASTETGCVLGAPIAEQRPGWMGRAMPGWEAKVIDDEDLEQPAGVAGELVLRPGQPHALSAGYWGRPEATVESWRNLWFHTGDRVVRDEDGWFRFVDRMNDTIRRRGENIASSEVEAVLSVYPGIDAVAVFAVPSELGEDEVMATVACSTDAAVDPLELVRWCEGRLAYFAIPRYIDVVDALPLTENGKARKAALRTQGVTATTWDLERSGHRLTRPHR